MEGCLAALVGRHTRIRLRRAQAGSLEVECGLRSQAQKRDYDQGVPTNAQRFAVIIDGIPHERCLFSAENRRLATGRFPLHCVFSKWS